MEANQFNQLRSRHSTDQSYNLDFIQKKREKWPEEGLLKKETNESLPLAIQILGANDKKGKIFTAKKLTVMKSLVNLELKILEQVPLNRHDISGP